MSQLSASLNTPYRLFLSFPEIICIFSSRKSENMSLVYADTSHALENRRLFLQGLNIDSRDLVCAQQVHGSQVRYARQADKGKGAFSHADSLAKTDALVTDQKNLPLAIFIADCLAIFL